MRKLGGILILCAATTSLSGCAFRNLGPCYGFGCPRAGQESSAQAPKSATASAPGRTGHKWWPFGKAQSQSSQTQGTKPAQTGAGTGQ